MTLFCRDKYDIQKFICEVKKRPSIWNFKSAEYSNKYKRCKDWTDICEAMVPGYGEKSQEECTEIECELQTKWKVLRDSFVRSLRNRRKVSAEGGTCRPYKYHDQMIFLMILFKNETRRRRTNYKSLWLKNESLPEEEPKITSVTIRNNVPKKVSNVENPKENGDSNEDLVETITNNVMMRLSNDNDDDKQFLLCLLNDMKRIPMEMKLDAKSDIINVIRHYTSKAGQYHTVDYIDADPLVTMELMSEDSQDSEKESKVNT